MNAGEAIEVNFEQVKSVIFHRHNHRLTAVHPTAHTPKIKKGLMLRHDEGRHNALLRRAALWQPVIDSASGRVIENYCYPQAQRADSLTSFLASVAFCSTFALPT